MVALGTYQYGFHWFIFSERALVFPGIFFDPFSNVYLGIYQLEQKIESSLNFKILPIKKIAIVGPEYTGKSLLAAALAENFETVWVPEIARSYLENLNRPYNQSDVEIIARLQIEEEDRMITTANQILFCDTTLLVIKVWMENAYGFCPAWILESIKSRHYDLFLLPDIDLEWQPDPLREHPNAREYFKELYIKELIDLQANYKIISGKGLARTLNGAKAVKFHFPDLLQNKTI